MEKRDPSKKAARSNGPLTSVEEFERVLHKHLPSIFEPLPEGMEKAEQLKKLVPVPISDEEMGVLENYEAPDHLQRILDTLRQKGLNPEEELPPDLLEKYHSMSGTMSQLPQHPYRPPQAPLDLPADELSELKSISRFKSYYTFLKGVQSLLAIYGVSVTLLWIIKGSIWFSASILPLHVFVFIALQIMSIFILFPLMIFKKSRLYSGTLLYQLTYAFGGIAWFNAAYYCLSVLKTVWFVVGVLMFGVGVAPIAVIGSMIKGQWGFFWFLAIQLISTFGYRSLAFRTISKS
jgi:hypothetical protein